MTIVVESKGGVQASQIKMIKAARIGGSIFTLRESWQPVSRAKPRSAEKPQHSSAGQEHSKKRFGSAIVRMEVHSRSRNHGNQCYECFHFLADIEELPASVQS
jgi:hypothetical protein